MNDSKPHVYARAEKFCRRQSLELFSMNARHEYWMIPQGICQRKPAPQILCVAVLNVSICGNLCVLHFIQDYFPATLIEVNTLEASQEDTESSRFLPNAHFANPTVVLSAQFPSFQHKLFARAKIQETPTRQRTKAVSGAEKFR